jgi:hypothetical protein
VKGKAVIPGLLKEKDIMSPKGNKQHIQDMAQRAGLPLTYEKGKSYMVGRKAKGDGTDSLGKRVD